MQVPILSGIFTDDAANGCPGTLVANSDSGALTITTTFQKYYATYAGTKPQVTGQTIYWIAFICAGASRRDRNLTGGISLSCNSGITYPTWPTDTQWHTHADATNDIGIYAVYQAIAGAQEYTAAGIKSFSGAISRLINKLTRVFSGSVS